MRISDYYLNEVIYNKPVTTECVLFVYNDQYDIIYSLLFLTLIKFNINSNTKVCWVKVHKCLGVSNANY